MRATVQVCAYVNQAFDEVIATLGARGDDLLAEAIREEPFVARLTGAVARSRSCVRLPYTWTGRRGDTVWGDGEIVVHLVASGNRPITEVLATATPRAAEFDDRLRTAAILRRGVDALVAELEAFAAA
jgi:hypothetical protein